jgi:acetyltransferase-like isoleucine patch superfamily enzyme
VGFYEFEGKRPEVADSPFVRPGATVTGGVTIGEGCYIGAGAVGRGDWCTKLYQGLPARCNERLRRL